MKAFLISILIISASIFGNFIDVHREINQLQTTKESITGIGKERVRILSDIRNSMLNYVKEINKNSLDSLINVGDNEFANYPWISDSERILLYLLIGRFSEIVESKELRKLIWIGDKYYGYQQKLTFPQFCIETTRAELILQQGFDFAPDLLNHLKSAYSNNYQSIYKDLENYKDLKDFLIIAKCENKVFPNPVRFDYQISKEQLEILSTFVKKYPNSKFSTDIGIIPTGKKNLTGNGFLIGAGPRYDVFSTNTNDIVSNGINGGFFVEARFPKLVTTANFEIRTFTALGDVKIKDTTFTNGTNLNLFRFQANLGIPFVWRNFLLITPYTGMMTSNLYTNLQDEKKYQYDKRSSNTFGIPLGTTFDIMLYNIPTNNMYSTIISGLGIRLNAEYQYSNWSDLEGNLDDHGLSFGALIYWGLFGSK